jgi:hypothetical protein
MSGRGCNSGGPAVEAELEADNITNQLRHRPGPRIQGPLSFLHVASRLSALTPSCEADNEIPLMRHGVAEDYPTTLA